MKNIRVILLCYCFLLLACLRKSLASGKIKKLYPSQFNFLAFFFEVEGNKPICSGTVVGRYFVLTTTKPLVNFMVASVSMTLTQEINHNNMSSITQHQIEEILPMSKELIVVKLADPLSFTVTLGSAPLDAIIYPRKTYFCTLPVWATDIFKDPEVGKKMDYNLHRQAVVDIAYNPLRKESRKGSYAYFDLQSTVNLYRLNFGSPVLCGIATVGIFHGFKGEPIKDGAKLMTAIKLDPLVVRDMIQAMNAPPKQDWCIPAKADIIIFGIPLEILLVANVMLTYRLL